MYIVIRHKAIAQFSGSIRMAASSVHLIRDTRRDFTADRRTLILSALALAVGSFGAGAAWLLLELIAFATNIAYFQRLSTESVSFADAHLPLWTMLAPVIGGLIVGLMARFGSEKIRGHGIPEAIEAILIGQSRIEPKVAVLKPLSSAIAIGTGGPFGAEGPIIMTGGALGSLFAQLFHLSAAERKTMLVAGAAAGMTGVFGTPIAAVLLAVELLLFEWKPRSFVPVAAAAVVAAALRSLMFGSEPLFAHAVAPSIPAWGLALCAIAGILAGLQSGLITIALYGVEDLFRKLPIHWMWWPALGGLAVGVGGAFNPAVLGVGYDNIAVMIAGKLSAPAALSLLLDKAVVWIVALSSGTSGGVLAPLLIMGGALGALEAHIMPFGDAGFWALLGMTAILGGTMRAPLTSTAFAVELTGDTHILLPLFVASVAAFAVTVLVMRRSILTERIARRGHHITREYSIDPFLQRRVEMIMTRSVHTLPASMRVHDAIEFFTSVEGQHRHKSYPVVADDDKFMGMVSRADILRWMRIGERPEAQLGDMISETAVVGHADELVGELADRMADADIGRAPIVDRNSGHVVGLVARRDLLRVRAHVLHEERERRRLLRIGVGGKQR
jgi:H+/Cl- antiporter ClcA